MSSVSALAKIRNLLDYVEHIQRMNAIAAQHSTETPVSGTADNWGKNDASYDESLGIVIIISEVQRTQYEGRTERIENVSLGTQVNIVREPNNQYNCNNLSVQNSSGESLGNLSEKIANALSPLIDEGYVSIQSSKVSYVEARSKRNARARKAVLYVEMKIQLKKIKLDNSNGCIVCLLGGDQARMWSQQLTVYKCNIPMDHAKGLFELYNRFRNEYETIEKGDTDLFYVGLDNLIEEIIAAREKMGSERKDGFDYSANLETETFGEYVLKSAEEEPERYGQLVQYMDEDYGFDDDDLGQLQNFFQNNEIHR